jgi:2,3-diketo-5-methylthio-1-phosphopentane phosphatase
MHHALGERDPERRGWHESEIVSVVGGPGPGPACLIGVLETGHAFAVLHLRPEPGAAGDECVARIDVELCVEAALAPGETRPLEAVRVALGDDPTLLLERFAELWGRVAGARRASAFQAGWCSWYHFFHRVSEQDLLRNLDALAADRSGLPVELVQLDDGYQRAIGDWLETNEKFPRGLEPVARAIRDAGFEAGLWTAPFAASEESRLLGEHPDWTLRDAEGRRMRGSYNPVWSADGWVYALDTSRDDVIAHLEALFASLVGMGFAYQKLDFVYMAALRGEAADRSLGRAERLRRGLDAIRRGAGDEAFLLGCGAPLGPAVGVVDGMRIGPDVAPSWAVEQPVVIPGLEETLPATRSALRSTLCRQFMHRRLWLNDPDCLMARSRKTELSADEAESLASVIGLSGGMVVFSDDVPELAPDERARVRAAIELARQVDAAGPRGVARLVDPLHAQPLLGAVQQLCASLGRESLVGVVNPLDEAATCDLDSARLGLRPAAIHSNHLAGTVPGGEAPFIHGRLRPHQSAVYRIRDARQLAVFCDFDGTFSVRDVGSTLAQQYLSEARAGLWQRFARGELDAWEYAVEIFDGFSFSVDALEDFLTTIELDPGARSLLSWCEAHGAPLRILSDGFDHNLDRLQAIHGVRFEHSANRLRFEGDLWRIEPGNRNPACSCGTGSCKRDHIESWRRRHPGSLCVHIGNGRVSDLCGAEAADLVFAKDTLAPALDERGVFHHRFETLEDVIVELERFWGPE